MAGCDSTTRRLIKAIEENKLEEAKTLLKQSVERASNPWVEGYPILCKALQSKKREFAKLLLENNARVNGKCYKSEGWPLYFAVINNDLEMTKLLLEKGANPDQSNKEKSPVMCDAIKADNIEIVELLCKHGAKCIQLIFAIQKGKVEITKMLLKYEKNVNRKVKISRHGENKTALHFAAESNQPEIVELLLKNGADINAHDKNTKTPFQHAIDYGHEGIIKIFLKYGANVNDIFKEDKETISPLYTALCNRSQEVVELLIKAGANINGNKKDSEVPLHAAVINGNLKIVKSLLELGAKVNYPSHSQKNKGYTALHYAAENSTNKSFYKNDSSSNSLLIIEYLISKGADVNSKDASGKTPLFCAIKKCDMKIIKCLLKHGADLNVMYDSHYGYTPLHYACEIYSDSSHKLVDLLLKNGANINARAKNNYLPIHVAIKNQRIEVIDLLLKKGVSPDTRFNKRKSLLFVALCGHECLKVVQTILKYKPNLQSKSNIHAFIFAVKKYGNYPDEVVKLFLEYGFRMRPKDIKNEEFIHASFRNEYMIIVNDILQYCTDINMKYDLKKQKGYTLLHSAVDRKNMEVLKSLLNHGVDLSVKDSEGKTALFYAIRKSNLDIVKQLLIAMKKVSLPIIPDYLSEAIRSQYKEMIELLIENTENLDAIDEDGNPPLFYTTLSWSHAWNKGIHYYPKNIENEEIAKFLLSKGADPNNQTKEGKSILYCAVVNHDSGLVENLLLQNANPNSFKNNQYIPLHAVTTIEYSSSRIAELLLKHKANVNAINSVGKTALHLASAVDKDILSTIEILIKYKANINCTDIDGMTPLHIAAKLDNDKVVRILLQNKAYVNAKSLNGKTPLHFASERGSYQCITNLLQCGADINAEDIFKCTALEHALESARSQEERGEIKNDWCDEDSNSDEYDDDYDEECFDPGYDIYAADSVVEILKNNIRLRLNKKKHVSKRNLELMNITVPKRQRIKRSRHSFW